MLGAAASSLMPHCSTMPFRELAMTAWSSGNALSHHEPAVTAAGTAALPALEKTAFEICGRGAQEACPVEMVASLAGSLKELNAVPPEYMDCAAAAIQKAAKDVDGDRMQTAFEPDPTISDAGPAVLEVGKDLLVLWKPSGWVVNVRREASAGFAEEDMLGEEPGDQALLLAPWIAQNLGPRSPISADPDAQHGILHRLDAETSGPLVCGTSYTGYALAMLQFGSRNVIKEYLCLCHGWLSPQVKMMEQPLRYGERQAADLEGQPTTKLRAAKTEILSVAHFTAETAVSLVAVRLHTGRRNQIRAHLLYQGHPLVGDKIYGDGAGAKGWCRRLFLHSYRLRLDIGHGPLEARCELPDDLRATLSRLAPRDELARHLQEHWLQFASKCSNAKTQNWDTSKGSYCQQKRTCCIN
eukprot:s712_g19.t1